MSFFDERVLMGIRVKSLRERFDESQERFAKRLGVSLYTVWRWENFKSKPSLLALEKLEKLDRKAMDK